MDRNLDGTVMTLIQPHRSHGDSTRCLSQTWLVDWVASWNVCHLQLSFSDLIPITHLIQYQLIQQLTAEVRNEAVWVAGPVVPHVSALLSSIIQSLWEVNYVLLRTVNLNVF